MQPFAAVLTRWIDGTGAITDLGERLGRLGDDVAAYALHTLGWVRLVQISRYSEYAFDARSVRDAAADVMVETIRRQARLGGHQLLRVEAFDGHDWLHQTGPEADRLIAFIRHAHAEAALGAPAAVLHQIPYSIDRLWTLGDPQIRAVAEAWRGTGGKLLPELDAAIKQDCPDRSVKVMVPSGPTFRFDRYRGSRTGPWDRNVWNRFVGETVQEIVPDPVLARSVIRAGELVLRSRSPRLERCRGPVLATNGLRDFAWYRLSLPVWRAEDDRDGTPSGVLMVLSPDWREDEAA